jgi:hypothetical protein
LARREFQKLIERLRAVPGAPDPVRDGFGDRSLFIGAKMFAHLEDSGALVLRLPPERAAELIAQGVGSGWGVTEGTELKGYLAVGARSSSRWFALAQEAQAYKAGKGPKKGARPAPRS